MKQMLSSENNCLRKAHRLRIPIKVIINNFMYSVVDWSTQGFKLEHNTQEVLDIEIDDEVSASLVLYAGNASIVLDVKAVLRSISSEHYGFEITDINDKNRRVLRHYATLAIDGNTNYVDDLSASVFMSDVQSPIKEPISLTEKEHKEVHASLRKKILFYTVFSLFFIVVAFMTFLYNYVIIYKSPALVSGNSKYYSASKDGIIKSIYVKNSQIITKGQLLFELDTEKETEQLKALNSQKDELNRQILNSKDMIKSIKKQMNQSLHVIKNLNENENTLLKNSYQTQKETYENAKILFEKKLITLKTYTSIQNQYLSFMANYDASSDKGDILENGSYLKTQDQILSLSRFINDTKIKIQKIDFEMQSLQQSIDKSTVLSDEDAIVHNIFFNSGNSVKYLDKILTLETQERPYLLTKVLSSEISKIELGGSSLLYSKRQNRIYQGHVVGIGYSITEGITTNTTDVSKNEIPVRIELDDANVRFHLNEYLEAYFINNSKFVKDISKIVPEKLLVL
jgi:multidrug resistance efflux pump